MAFGADAVYHNAMKRWLIRLLVVVVSLFGLMLVAGLVTRSVISGSSQHGLAADAWSKKQSSRTSKRRRECVWARRFDSVNVLGNRCSIRLSYGTVSNPQGLKF